MPKKKIGLAAIIGLGIFLGLMTLTMGYFLLGGGYGIAVSCDKQQFLGIERVPPPLLSIIAPTQCVILYKVTVNGTELCSGKHYDDGPKAIVSCKGVEDYRWEDLEIKATIAWNDKGTDISKNADR